MRWNGTFCLPQLLHSIDNLDFKLSLLRSLDIDLPLFQAFACNTNFKPFITLQVLNSCLFYLHIVLQPRFDFTVGIAYANSSTNVKIVV